MATLSGFSGFSSFGNIKIKELSEGIPVAVNNMGSIGNVQVFYPVNHILIDTPVETINSTNSGETTTYDVEFTTARIIDGATGIAIMIGSPAHVTSSSIHISILLQDKQGLNLLQFGMSNFTDSDIHGAPLYTDDTSFSGDSPPSMYYFFGCYYYNSYLPIHSVLVGAGFTREGSETTKAIASVYAMYANTMGEDYGKLPVAISELPQAE